MTGLDDAEQLFGAWSLHYWRVTGDDGTVTMPWGENLVGYLLYAPSGVMSGMSTTAGRPNLPATSVRNGAVVGNADEAMAIVSQFSAYSGTFEVDCEAGDVLHHVTVSIIPNWTGRTMRRHVRFEGDHLELSTPPYRDGSATFTASLGFNRVP
jgi:hypothetical protein